MTKRRGVGFIAPAILATVISAIGPVQARPPWDPQLDASVFAPIDDFGPRVALRTIARGMTAPNRGAMAPGDDENMYVADQAGAIWRVSLETGSIAAIANLSSRLITLGIAGPGSFDERGLLGLALHPGFAGNGLLYTYTSEPNDGAPSLPSTLPAGTAPNHQNVLAEWRIASDGNVDLASRRELLRIDWPQFNHNAGDLAFGPDDMLYIALGDGGNADDQGVGHLAPNGNAQALSVPLGKILRIDVNTRSGARAYGIPADNPFVSTAGALPEIWAYGFRNPFRISFDRRSGELYAGDVGQGDIEELSRVARGGNHGWNFKEGTLFFDPNGDRPGFATPDPVAGRSAPAGLIDPIAQYDTSHDGHSIIAGYVYRGSALRGLSGHMIFGDYSSVFRFPAGPNDHGRLLHVNAHRGRGLRDIAQFQTVTGNSIGLAVLGFGQDSEGELYVLGNVTGTPSGTGGVMMKIEPAPRRGSGHR